MPKKVVLVPIVLVAVVVLVASRLPERESGVEL